MRGWCAAALAASLILGACGRQSGPETSGAGAAATPPVLRVGHVGHDHHTALYVAADHAEEFARAGGVTLRPVEDRTRYELIDGGRKLADVEIVVVGGGSQMPTALAQGVIDIGLGGVAPVLAANDKGAPVKLIAPLHSRGDMLAVSPDLPAATWDEFVAHCREAAEPVRVGYKSPVAVAKVVFEAALEHEGVPFSGNPADTDARVILINVKGGGNLNASVAQGVVDAYVGNNPFPAIGVDKDLVRIVCDLEDLPPGTFRDHPCCCVGANANALADKPEAIEAVLVLLTQATQRINEDRPAAIAAASRWIGTSEAVEAASIPTSGYSVDTGEHWRARMAVWIDAMNELVFTGELEGLDEPHVAQRAYDFTLLDRARARLAH